MAAPKASGDSKLFEIVCYMSVLKVTKVQPATPNHFWAVFKKKQNPPKVIGCEETTKDNFQKLNFCALPGFYETVYVGLVCTIVEFSVRFYSSQE